MEYTHIYNILDKELEYWEQEYYEYYQGAKGAIDNIRNQITEILNIEQTKLKYIIEGKNMTTNKMSKIIDIIENKLSVNISDIKGNQQIYGLICSLDKYTDTELNRILKLIEEYSDLFTIETIIEMIKNNSIWR